MSFSTRFKVSPPLGPGDLLFHHAIGVGLHVSILILLKGSLDAPGSHLIPDKINFAVSFPYDGPIRGGTCDISAFDSVYLAFFWMLNTPLALSILQARFVGVVHFSEVSSQLCSLLL
jgi:hypothetical protein